MKMFVWNKDVLTDYGDGIVCVLARDLKHAYKQLTNSTHHYDDCLKKRPDIVFEKEGIAELFGSA